jgi:hypothetical protein
VDSAVTITPLNFLPLPDQFEFQNYFRVSVPITHQFRVYGMLLFELCVPCKKPLNMKAAYFYLLILLLAVSCGQNDKGKTETNSDTTASKAANTSGNNTISFKADGETINSEGWIVQRFVWDNKTPSPWLNIVSNMHKDKRSINVNLNGTAAVDYTFAENAPLMSSSHGSYFPDYSNPMGSYSFISGKVSITEIDTVANLVSGTFEVTAKSNDGKTVTITEGRINKVPMKAGITNLSGELDKIGN